MISDFYKVRLKSRYLVWIVLSVIKVKITYCIGWWNPVQKLFYFSIFLCLWSKYNFLFYMRIIWCMKYKSQVVCNNTIVPFSSCNEIYRNTRYFRHFKFCRKVRFLPPFQGISPRKREFSFGWSEFP